MLEKEFAELNYRNREVMDNKDMYLEDINDYKQISDRDESSSSDLADDNDQVEPSVCDNCERGDEWECRYCCSKCYEDYGECPDPNCDPMDI